jgi:EAL domain-containing protein (putative c-di-GMP-specific phosphodiesterase class I)
LSLIQRIGAAPLAGYASPIGLPEPKMRASDRRPMGAEALMRWQHRSRGLVSPNVFIPIAELGQIRAMTMWAMNTALRQATEWHDGPCRWR